MTPKIEIIPPSEPYKHIYVASSWKNPLQEPIVAMLKQFGHGVYDFKNPTAAFNWKEFVPRPEWTAEEFRQAMGEETTLKAYSADMEALGKADAFLLIMPAGVSASIEFGIAVMRGLPLYLFWVGPQKPDLMLAPAVIISTWMELAHAFKTNLYKDPSPTT